MTIPYKKHKNYLPKFNKEAQFGDQISQRIEVFNTIIKTENSQIKLFNTDYFGIDETLKLNNAKNSIK